MTIHQNKYIVHLISNLRKLSDQTYVLFATIWTGVTAYLSLVSARVASQFNVWDFVGVDKLGHLVFYSVFSFLWCMGLARTYVDKKFILIFTISFGVLMEICQLYLFNGRSFELYDVLANVIGSIIGIILFKNLLIYNLCSKN